MRTLVDFVHNGPFFLGISGGHVSFNHRHLWSTGFILNLLRTGRLSDAAIFRYFFAIMIFDWLQFTLIATTPTPSMSPWSTVGSWSTFAITVLGLLYLYRMNGGSKGSQFLQRYFPLSITVGWKFVAAMLGALWLIPVVLVGQSNETVGWTATVSLAVINILMFWRIGFHLRSLSNEAGDGSISVQASSMMTINLQEAPHEKFRNRW